MNFFKSILSDDADPPKPSNPHESDPNPPPSQPAHSKDAVEGSNAGGWSFGSLLKTLAAQSESVIETYRRDLQEFGTGLKKETEVLKDVASRAVKDLPSSIEARTHHLEGVLKSTAEIISEKAQILASDGDMLETPDTKRRNSTSSGRYSWFDAQLGAIQSDLGTFCEEPEDEREFKEWRLGFVLEDKRKEIEGLVGESGALEGVYRRCVPGVVDEETFWLRYFYRVEKLRQQERVRANLVKRAMAGGVEEDEELSWDVDDEEEDGAAVKVAVSDGSLSGVEKGESAKSGSDPNVGRVGESYVIESRKVNEKELENNEKLGLDEKEVNSEGVLGVKSDEKAKVQENVRVKSDEKVKVEENVGAKSDEKAKLQENVRVKSDDKAKLQENIVVESNDSVGMEEKGEKSGEKSEEDMGWDEIEDIGSGDEKNISSGNPNRSELRKRLSAAEDDEDLNWDIEDDDKPVKT